MTLESRHLGRGRASHSRTCACDASWLESRKRMCHDLQRHHIWWKLLNRQRQAAFGWLRRVTTFQPASTSRRGVENSKFHDVSHCPEQLVFLRVATSNLRVEHRVAIRTRMNPDEPPDHWPLAVHPLCWGGGNWRGMGAGTPITKINKRPKIITNIHSYDTYSGRMIYTDL